MSNHIIWRHHCWRQQFKQTLTWQKKKTRCDSNPHQRQTVFRQSIPDAKSHKLGYVDHIVNSKKVRHHFFESLFTHIMKRAKSHRSCYNLALCNHECFSIFLLPTLLNHQSLFRFLFIAHSVEKCNQSSFLHFFNTHLLKRIKQRVLFLLLLIHLVKQTEKQIRGSFGFTTCSVKKIKWVINCLHVFAHCSFCGENRLYDQ